MNGKPKNIAALTGVRGVSALWVVLFHVYAFSKYFGFEGCFDSILIQYGWSGVDLFFILSGFVLMHVHQRDFADRLDMRQIGRFAWLRFFRVYPVATVVLLMILALVLAFPAHAYWFRSVHYPEDFTPFAFVKTLLLVTRLIPPFRGDWNQPVWSLSVELIGYALFPLLAYAASRTRSAPALFALTAAFFILPTALFFFKGVQGGNNIGSLSIPRGLGFFACGIFVYRIWQHFPNPSSALSIAIKLSFPVMLYLIFALKMPWIFPIFYMALIYCIAREEAWTKLLFANKATMISGKLSFPVYLCHAHALIFGAYIASHNDLSQLQSALLLAASIIGPVILSWGLHVYVETPVHRWARKTAGAPKGAASARRDAPAG